MQQMAVSTKAGVEQDQSNKAELKKQGIWVRGVSLARRWVGDLENYPSLTVESGRYHIYIAYNCPWCHRVALTRSVLGLTDAISMSVCMYKREETNGLWQFNPSLEKEEISQLANAPKLVCTEDTGNMYNGKKMRESCKLITEIYEKDGLKEKSVPILYDKKEQKVVNNESSEIIIMFSTVFLKIAKNPLGLQLYPTNLQLKIDEINIWIYDCINNGSYIAGFSTNQARYEECYEKYFNGLDRIETILSGNRFLLGNNLTLADIRLFPTLFRHDAIYYLRMYLNKYYLKENYPNICNYIQNIYQIPGIAESSNLTHCIRGYFGRTGRRVIPKIPLKYVIDFNGKHNRIEKFGKLDIDTAIENMKNKEERKESKENDNDSDSDIITISGYNGSNVVKISLHGGTVISWKVDGIERLFLSSKSCLDGSKAIRGGIPIVFPQFGPGMMKQHGFARMLKWKIKEIDNKNAFTNSVTLCLENIDGITNKEPWNWKHKFRLEYTVIVLNKNTIQTDLKIINNNNDNSGDNDKHDGSFEFTTLFHNYFNVKDVSKVKIDGLNNDTFEMKIDKVSNKTEKDKDDFIGNINNEIDSIFVNHDNNKVIKIDDTISILQGNEMKDIVVWNPWQLKSKEMSDMDDDGYTRFVCVEIGCVTKETQLCLKSGQSCLVSQQLSVNN